MIKLDLGCGSFKPAGYIGIDIANVNPLTGQAFRPDIYADLNKGIPCGDNTVDEVRASHVLEHVKNPHFLLNEIHRVCKNKAKVTIIVPLYEVCFVNDKDKFNIIILEVQNNQASVGLMPNMPTLIELRQIDPHHITAFFPFWFERNMDSAQFKLGEKSFWLQEAGITALSFYVMRVILEVIR